MYTTQLSRLFAALIEDYEVHNVRDLLARVIGLLGSRQAVSDAVYAAQAKELLQRAKRFEENNSYSLMSKSDQIFLDESQFGPTLPDKVSRLILKSLPLERSRGAPSSELAYFLEIFDTNLNKLYNFQNVVSDLPLRSFSPDSTEITFSIVVSERSFSGDLNALCKVFEQFDLFIGSVHEAIGSSDPKPRVLFLDNGSVIVVMAATVVVVQSIISMYSAVVEAAQLTANLLSALGVIKTTGDDGGITKEKLGEFGDKFLEQALNKQLGIIIEDNKREIPEGVRSKLRITSSMLVERVRQGSKITVNTVSERSAQRLTENEQPDADADPELLEQQVSIPDLIAQSRVLERIADAVSAQVKPTPQLEGPETGQLDV